MQQRSNRYLFVLALILLAGAFYTLKAAVLQADAKKEEKQTTAQKCLACHGSFDKLAEKTVGFIAPSGETTTPHRYVPHADKTDIPECTECHIPHPVPREEISTQFRPEKKLAYCYQSCHHASNLQPCKNCH
jgi:hypothetical protein